MCVVLLYYITPACLISFVVEMETDNVHLNISSSFIVCIAVNAQYLKAVSIDYIELCNSSVDETTL